MEPALHPLNIHRGTKRRYSFALKSAVDGPAIDLTGSTFTGQLRRNPASPEPLMDLEISTGTPSAGIISFVIDDSDFSLDSSVDQGVYDILWTQPDGSKPKLLMGPAYFHKTATQPTAP